MVVLDNSFRKMSEEELKRYGRELSRERQRLLHEAKLLTRQMRRVRRRVIELRPEVHWNHQTLGWKEDGDNSIPKTRGTRA